MKALKEIVRKYYKYINIPWIQPVLSADGTIGGDDFACFASSIYSSSYPVYKAFDGVISNLSSDHTWWCTSSKSGVQFIGFYNPDRIKVTNIRFYNQKAVSGDGVIASGTVQASLDNTNYIDLGTFSGNTFGTEYFDIDLNSNTNYYNYYRIVATGYSGNYATCGELEITATIQDIEESDESDYDFYKDVIVYKSTKKAKRTYYKTIFESSTPDTYNLEITNAGTYSIEMYGAGGGWARGGYPVSGHYDNTIATGGSGAGFKGILNLPVGSYSLTVGAGGTYVSGGRGTTGGNTNFNDIISANGATGGYTIYGGTNQSVRVGGVGGTLQIIDSSYITSISKQTNGRNGNSTAVTDALAYMSGATSVYDDTITGYGAGGGSSHEAVNGYCKIVRISEDSSDYDYYTEISVCKAVKTKR